MSFTRFETHPVPQLPAGTHGFPAWLGSVALAPPCLLCACARLQLCSTSRPHPGHSNLLSTHLSSHGGALPLIFHVLWRNPLPTPPGLVKAHSSFPSPVRGLLWGASPDLPARPHRPGIPSHSPHASSSQHFPHLQL